MRFHAGNGIKVLSAPPNKSFHFFIIMLFQFHNENFNIPHPQSIKNQFFAILGAYFLWKNHFIFQQIR